MATYAYFVDRNEKLADDARIVYVSFGAENSGHCGSHEFVEAHPEYAGAKVLCIGDIAGDALQVAEYDAVRRITFSTDMVATLHASAIEQDIPLKTARHDDLKHKFNSLHGYMSNAFVKNGNPSATVLAKDYSRSCGMISRETLEDLFSLCVGTMENLCRRARARKLRNKTRGRHASCAFCGYANCGRREQISVFDLNKLKSYNKHSKSTVIMSILNK